MEYKMLKFISMLMLCVVFSSSAYAQCPRNSTVQRIFGHLFSGQKVNIDGNVWAVERMNSDVEFLDGDPQRVDTPKEALAQNSKTCAYEAYDARGHKSSLTMNDHGPLHFR